MNMPSQSIMLERAGVERQAPRLVCVEPSRPFAEVAERPSALRTRFKAGPLELDYRFFPKQRALTITPTEADVHIVVPLSGKAVAVDHEKSVTLNAGQGLLLAAASRASCVWAPGSAGLLLHVRRAVIQAEASHILGNPRRLAMINLAFRWPCDALTAYGVGQSVGKTGGLPEGRLAKGVLASLIGALLSGPQGEDPFPVARSVQRAVEQIRANPNHSWSLHDLAAAAGVTAATLQRNFRTCLGVTVTQLVQTIRLEWVRSRLESVTESRAIGELSLASGFGASGMLNRAYQRHFGETPSQTRSRAFRSRRD